jgi:hypothetical protein
MSNPTTPFSWQMPTSTDLVTDLPADFEVFGQAVATSMADLLSGTTGQILSKASGTDMDFTWITLPSPVQNFALINAGGTALTGSGTTTINVSDKNQLFIRVIDASAVGGTCDLRIRFNSDTGANYGYIMTRGQNNTGTTFVGYEVATADTALMVGNNGNAEANTISANVMVSGANATGYKPISLSSYALGNGAYMGTGDAWYSGTSVITSVSIISNGQNFDGGTVFIYGA